MIMSPFTSNIAMPERQVRLRYSSFKALAGTSGVLGEQVVACGDIFDPDRTGVGHQPLGHDQWSAFYGAYIVVRSKIQVWYMYNQAQAVSTQPVVGMFRDDTTALLSSTWDALVEQGRSKYLVVPASLNVVSPDANMLTLDYDAKRDFNLTDIRDNESRIGAATGASPSDNMFYHIWAQSVDQATTSAVMLVYTVDYDVIFSKPKELGQS